MAVRFYAWVKEGAKYEYKIEIHDTEFTGTALELDLGPEGFNLSYQGQGADRFSPIKTCKATVPIMVVPTAVAYINVFKAEFLGAQENRFYLNITSFGEPFFAGPLLQDLGQIEYDCAPYLLTLTATDGLSRLKEEAENVAGSNIVEKLTKILNRTGLQEIKSNTDEFLAISTAWLENNMDSVYLSDPLVKMDFHENGVFYDINEDGEIEYKSWYECLEIVLKTIGARLFMAWGRFNVVQINEYNTDTQTFTVFPKNYSVGLDPTTPVVGQLSRADVNTVIDFDAGAVEIEAEPYFNYMPALKKVNAVYNLSTAFLIYEAKNLDITTALNVGTIIVATGVGLNFTLGQTYRVYNHNFSQALFDTVLKYKIQLGSYYLNNNNGVYSWSTTLGYVEQKDSILVDPGITTILEVFSPITFIIPTVPVSATLSIQTETVIYKKNTTTVEVTSVNVATETDLKVSYYDNSGVEADKEIAIEATNTKNTSSSEVKDLGELLFGDFASPGKKNQLFVYNGSAWVGGGNWAVDGLGGKLNVSELLVREVIQGQINPCAVFDGALIGGFCFGNILEYKGAYFLPNGGRFVASGNTWNVEAFRLQRDISNDTVGSENNNLPTLQVINNNGTANSISAKNLEANTLTYTTGEAAGLTDSIGIAAAGDDILSAGDIIELTNPITGQSEEVTVAADVAVGATEIQIEEVTLSNYYPSGVNVAISLRRIFQRLRGTFNFTLTGGDYYTKHLVGHLVLILEESETYTLPLISTLNTLNIAVTIKNENQQSADLICSGTDLIDGQTGHTLVKYETVSFFIVPGNYYIYG